MRADRLLAILMLLQARGKLTAQALAAELEVSERTIYRDVEALSIAGVPVYAEAGVGGGIGLLEDYRTTLTGLTDAEIAALYVLNVPAPLDDLGLSGHLAAALRKLTAALPAQRGAAHPVRSVHIDAAGWGRGDEPAPYLHALYAAIQQAQPVVLRYRHLGGAEVVTAVEPYGLVAKAGVWYLLFARAGRVAALQVAALTDVEILPGTVTPPPDFDLQRCWEQWCRDTARLRPQYAATVRIAPGLLPHVSRHLGSAAAAQAVDAPRDAAGWVTLTLNYESLESARTHLLGLGNAVEVVAPLPLRRSLVDFAERILELYGVTPAEAR